MRLRHVLLSSIVWLGAAVAQSDGVPGVETAALGTIIKRADAYLSVGQFGDAIRSYSEAIDIAPSDYLLYYKRATAYFSGNRHSNALEDFEKVLRLTNGAFDKALLYKAKIFTREGDWAEARGLAKKYSQSNANAKKEVQDLLFSISEGESATKKAQKARLSSQFGECVEQTSVALNTASHSTALRELRAECAMSHSDIEQALGDLTRLTHLTKPSAELFLRIASISYSLLPPNTQATQTLKQCLHYDPDSKPCRSALRSLKTFDKEFAKLDVSENSSSWATLARFISGSANAEDGLAARFDAYLDSAAQAAGLPPTVIPRKRSPRRERIYGLACKAYVKSNQIAKAKSWCDETLLINNQNLDGLIGAGEEALAAENWEEAVRVFERAFEASGRSSREIQQSLEKAKRLLKVSKQKDYYKVLGVSRSADAKEIKKAFRKASKSAHPDKGGSEAKMAALNEAYEVLSNPELRAKFDNGEDPNDPMAGQGGHGGHPFGGHPFQQAFFQNGGGGFQFQWSG